MSSSTVRRPLPALAFLLVLTILTAIVWWRVLHRPQVATGGARATVTTPTPTCSAGKKPVALPAPKSVSVHVYNGAGKDGLATSVRAQLNSRGFTTTGADTAPSQLAGLGELRYGPSGRGGAALLSYYLPGLKPVPVSRPDAGVDVVLGTAFTAVAPPATVSQAVAKAKKPC
jgi:hypothetical protein